MTTTDPVFENLYTGKILPQLKEAEKIRKKILLNYSIVGFVLFVGLSVEAVTWMSIALVIVILFVLFYTRWYGIPVSRYEDAYVHAITLNTIQQLAPGLILDNSSHLKLSDLRKTYLLNSEQDYFSGKNLIHGNAGGQEIRLSEIYSSSKIRKEDSMSPRHEAFNALVIVSDKKLNTGEVRMICTSKEIAERLKNQLGLEEKTIADGLIVLQSISLHSAEETNQNIYPEIKKYHALSKKHVLFTQGENGTSVAILNERGFTYLAPTVLRTALNKKAAELYFRDMQFLINAIS